MKRIADNILVFDSEVKIMPWVHFPLRSTLIELEDKELLIVSPGPFEEEPIRNFLSSYSKVYCLAPNALHHVHLEKFNKWFPQTPIYGPEELKEKQNWIGPILRNPSELKKEIGEQISLHEILGNPFLKESVVYVKKNKSLVLTDLLFNMRAPMPLGRAMLLSLVGAKNKVAQSKVVKLTTKDKTTYRQSVDHLLNLHFERIIVSHGEVMESTQDLKDAIHVLKNSI